MKKQLSIARTLSLDFLLNIAATLISTGTMQLLLYPQLAANLGEVSYGTMLTIMGAVNVIVLAFGNNLAQVRLVNEHDYENKEENGDFQIFLLVSCFLSSICILAVCFLMNIPKAEIAPIIILVITTVLKSYYLVAFRLSIDYRRNLVANIIMALGYILAAVFLLSIFHWSWAFTIANILCIIYICCSSKIIFDPLKITSLFRQSLKSYAMLIIGGLLSNLTTYLDRFIIYPLLGAASVSSFFVATYFSKSISLVFSR